MKVEFEEEASSRISLSFSLIPLLPEGEGARG
jgi:hypothetical protein